MRVANFGFTHQNEAKRKFSVSKCQQNFRQPPPNRGRLFRNLPQLMPAKICTDFERLSTCDCNERRGLGPVLSSEPNNHGTKNTNQRHDQPNKGPHFQGCAGVTKGRGDFKVASTGGVEIPRRSSRISRHLLSTPGVAIAFYQPTKLSMPVSQKPQADCRSDAGQDQKLIPHNQ